MHACGGLAADGASPSCALLPATFSQDSLEVRLEEQRELQQVRGSGFACAVPIHIPRDVHSGCNGDETSQGADQKRIGFHAKKDIDEGVEQAEGGKSPQSEFAASEDPVCVDREERHGGDSGDEKAEIEPEVF